MSRNLSDVRDPLATAPCATKYDAELWFPAGYSESHRGQIDEAKLICREECRFTTLCLDRYRNEPDGIFGGTTPDERNPKTVTADRPLTARQRAILELKSLGVRNIDIATRLGVKPRSVDDSVSTLRSRGYLTEDGEVAA